LLSNSVRGRVEIWSETKTVITLIRNGVVLTMTPIRIGLGGLSGIAIAFSTALGFAQTDWNPPPAPPSAQGQTAKETQTLKERLSDKASDQQRIDNCNVPVDRRGSKPRPDRCE